MFDSFQGIPENREDHKRDFSGNPICFVGGSYAGTIEEVVTNVGRYGHVDACRFVRGWFEDTMPTFKEPIAAAYLDVDLVSSTQTCLKYLYPLIMPGGFLDLPGRTSSIGRKCPAGLAKGEQCHIYRARGTEASLVL